MHDYGDFLRRSDEFARPRSIRWAVIGSRAMEVHARRSGVPPRRAPNDLDLIVWLPREHDRSFRAWLGPRESRWIYHGDYLGAIHFWCDDGRQVDLFPKPDTGEIDRSRAAEVLGVECLVVDEADALASLEGWARGAEDPGHAKHHEREKYRVDAEWYRRLVGGPQGSP